MRLEPVIRRTSSRTVAVSLMALALGVLTARGGATAGWVTGFTAISGASP